MKFTLTEHASKRLLERCIPAPSDKLCLKAAGKKIKKLIREKCKLKGYEFDKIYWVLNHRIVYVCQIVDAGEYIVITAFDLKQDEK